MRRPWLIGTAAALVLAGAVHVAAIYALPSVIMGIAVNRIADRLGVNRMAHNPLVTAETQTIVRPSPDLAYSICAFDLAGGPVLVEAAPVPGHYWSLSVYDSRTDTAFVRNDTEARGRPIRIVLARGGQAVPANAEVVRVAGNKGVALIRILLADPAELAAIDPLRRKGFCRPLK